MTRILVVEDEVSILENIIETLQLEKYSVMGAENGRIGVEVALREQPDLILCDISMPVLDGYGLLLELRGHPTTATTPLIFLTAHADHDSMRQGMEMGADDYLTKPFSHKELTRAVKTQLLKAQVARDMARRDNLNQLDDLRNTIIAALPHELRTPLSGIIGCADFLLLEPENIETEQLKSILEIILRSGTRLQRVLENYLVYTQMIVLESDEIQQKALREERCNYPGPLVMDTALTRALESGRGADLEQAVADAAICMSPDNFSRLVHELIDNAFKFSAPETPVSVVGEIQGDKYRLRISDQGRGMRRDQINRIGAYTQFDRDYYEQQGLGLGLIIAVKTVELHNGEFSIDSSPGDGTRVVITIPLAPQNEGDAAKSE